MMLYLWNKVARFCTTLVVRDGELMVFIFSGRFSMLATNRRVYRLVDGIALPTALADFYQQYLASCKPDSNIRLDRGMIYPCPVWAISSTIVVLITMLYPSLINFQIRIVLPLFNQAGLLLLVTFVTVLSF
jgi:hypothetical protein